MYISHKHDKSASNFMLKHAQYDISVTYLGNISRIAAKIYKNAKMEIHKKELISFLFLFPRLCQVQLPQEAS